ncbi:MAG: hypothetical protein RL003_509 [Bacteroidota bacterium]
MHHFHDRRTHFAINYNAATKYIPVPHINTEIDISRRILYRFDSMLVSIKQPTGILMMMGAKKTNKYTPPFCLTLTNHRFFLLKRFAGVPDLFLLVENSTHFCWIQCPKKIQTKLPKIPPNAEINHPSKSFSTKAIAQINPPRNLTPLSKKMPTKCKNPSSVNTPMIAI